MKTRWISCLALLLANVACGSEADDSQHIAGNSSGARTGSGGTNSTNAGSTGQGGTTQGGVLGNSGGGGSTTGGMPSSGGATGGKSTAGTSGTGTGGSAANSGSGGASAGSSGGSSVPPASAFLREPMGWATVAADGRQGTTGGGKATPVVVKSSGELNSAAGGSDPKVIHVDGEVGGSLKVGSNKTIIGLPGAKISNASLGGSTNVIIRNLKIQGGSDTVVTNDAHHVWIDHCELSDGADGVLDMTYGSDHFTISWTKIFYTRDGEHRYASLVGNRDDNTADVGKLHVTFYKVWWADKIQQRQPRVRNGQVHVLNNLYTSQDADYGIAPGVHANIRAEKNIFIDIPEALNATFYNSSDDAVLEEVGNVFKGTTTGKVGKMGTRPAFTPPYPYTADTPDDAMEASIRAGAGATLTLEQIQSL